MSRTLQQWVMWSLCVLALAGCRRSDLYEVRSCDVDADCLYEDQVCARGWCLYEDESTTTDMGDEGVVPDDGTPPPPSDMQVCPAERPERCDGMCVNTSFDSANCGACGNRCPLDRGSDFVCQQGTCVTDPCGPAQVYCRGECAQCPDSDGVVLQICTEEQSCEVICADGFVRCDEGCCPALSPPTPVIDESRELGERPSLEATGRDDVHVTYMIGETELRYARWDGQAWASEVIATDARFPVGPEHTHVLDLDGLGRPNVLYTDNATGGLRWLRREGTSWVEVGQSLPSIERAEVIGFVIDDRFRAYIAVESLENIFTILPRGDTYVASMPLEAIPGRTGNAGFTYEPISANAHLVAHKIDDTVSQSEGTVRWSYISPTSVAAASETIDEREGIGDCCFSNYTFWAPGVAADAQGRVHVAYTAIETSEEGTSLMYGVRTNRGVSIESVDTLSDAARGRPIIDVGPDGRPQIFYGERRGPDQVRWASLNGEAWRVQTILLDAALGDAEVDLASQGHVVYLEDNQLKYAYWDGEKWVQ